MQSSAATAQEGKFLARSLFDGRMVLLDPNAPIYLATAGAARKHVTADVLTKFEFHRKTIYVRTDDGLYALEHFVHLKDVRVVLAENYFAGNRGVAINGKALRYVRGSHTVGVHTRNAQGHWTTEWIALSDAGMRIAKKRFMIRPPRLRRRAAPPRARHASGTRKRPEKARKRLAKNEVATVKRRR